MVNIDSDPTIEDPREAAAAEMEKKKERQVMEEYLDKEGVRELPGRIETPMDPECEVSVVIPAHNEEESIEDTLTSLYEQKDMEGQPLDRSSYEVIIVNNNSTDRTAEVVRAFAEAHPDMRLYLVDETERGVGAARKRGMDEATLRFMETREGRGTIAGTDSDTEVSETWVAAIADEISQGHDAISGPFNTKRGQWESLLPEVRAEHDRRDHYNWLFSVYRSRLAGEEGHKRGEHHGDGIGMIGSNFAVRAGTYAEIGGMPKIKAGEDTELGRRIKKAGKSISKGEGVRTYTAVRESTRAEGGFGQELIEARKRAESGEILVKDPEELIRNAELKEALTDLVAMAKEGRADEFEMPPEISNIDREALIELARQSPDFGALVEKLRAEFPDEITAAQEAMAEEYPDIPRDKAIEKMYKELEARGVNVIALEIGGGVEQLDSLMAEFWETQTGDETSGKEFMTFVSDKYKDGLARMVAPLRERITEVITGIPACSQDELAERLRKIFSSNN